MARTELRNPQNCTVIFLDHPPQMIFGVANIDRQFLLDNTLVHKQKPSRKAS